ncbi:amidohydrolase [Microbacteriaceae bacterium SG_E_30_P1]|uniref:Amidohydrolase n=1 Tax=Antiquaquibacter oligotrophicus TaxID=2880260 RepID=A0ABT6KR37_9MICO|nr:M20 family metallopeptidase [Antiquaquibacter oligotrophicus]MDH6182452.1 amidohydrolase [Antiquaquibacter oligotrophicus]UDF14577.1 M20 family metallopeptidase [Antiquaquibacter oligotrophicus]
MSGFTTPSATTQSTGTFAHDLVTLRRELHGIPEVGLHLPQTQSAIIRQLEPLGLDSLTTGSALSSVVGVIRGHKPGPTVLLRSDMDALPVAELTGLPWASTNGAMHACGHDLHMAGLVGAAQILTQRRHDFAGSVILAFQPGEEGHGGAPLMLGEGLLDAAGPAPIASYALHVWPTLDSGVFATRPGAIMAGMNHLRVTVHGTGGHASSPHRVRDTVPVVAEIVLALQTYVTRRFDVSDPIVLTVTQLAADSAAINVIPDRSSLAASIRTLSLESVAQLAAELPTFVQRIAEAHGCTADVHFGEDYPVTVNDARATDHATQLLAQRFGEERLQPLDSPLMASEDFAFVLQRSPGAFILLGARPPGDSEPEQPHSSRVLFDDSGLADHANALVELALGSLAAAS